MLETIRNSSLKLKMPFKRRDPTLTSMILTTISIISPVIRTCHKWMHKVTNRLTMEKLKWISSNNELGRSCLRNSSHLNRNSKSESLWVWRILIKLWKMLWKDPRLATRMLKGITRATWRWRLLWVGAWRQAAKYSNYQRWSIISNRWNPNSWAQVVDIRGFWSQNLASMAQHFWDNWKTQAQIRNWLILCSMEEDKIPLLKRRARKS